MASGSAWPCRLIQSPGTAPGPDQRRTLVTPAGRFQPIIDRRIVGGRRASPGSQGTPHGRDIGDGAPGAVLGKPPPEPGQPERGGDQLVGWHHIGRAARCGHGRQFGIEAAGKGGDSVGAGKARHRAGRGRADGSRCEHAPASQPPPDRRCGRAGPRQRRGRGRRGCFQPGHGVLGLGEWHQKGMAYRCRQPAAGAGRRA